MRRSDRDWGGGLSPGCEIKRVRVHSVRMLEGGPGLSLIITRRIESGPVPKLRFEPQVFIEMPDQFRTSDPRASLSGARTTLGKLSLQVALLYTIFLRHFRPLMVRAMDSHSEPFLAAKRVFSRRTNNRESNGPEIASGIESAVRAGPSPRPSPEGEGASFSAWRIKALTGRSSIHPAAEPFVQQPTPQPGPLPSSFLYGSGPSPRPSPGGEGVFGCPRRSGWRSLGPALGSKT
jgi:hypothetical protein